MDPLLPHNGPAAQSDVQLLKFDNVEAAMAEAMNRDQALGDNGFVSVYDQAHVKIWPLGGRQDA